MDASLLADLLPADSGLRIEHVAVEDAAVVVELHTTAQSAACPHCHSASTSVHGRYRRRLQDQPCRGRILRLFLVARKSACRRAGCPRRVFCKRLPGLAEPRARTTAELSDAHRSIGFALGGEAGARLATKLNADQPGHAPAAREGRRRSMGSAAALRRPSHTSVVDLAKAKDATGHDDHVSQSIRLGIMGEINTRKKSNFKSGFEKPVHRASLNTESKP